jgi:RNAse (barnase) inhibitor barstar
MKSQLAVPKNFQFGGLEEIPLTDDALIGIVEASISDSTRLLSCLARALDFPVYFGSNWNALYDCLRDFHWTEKKHIFLFHRDVPTLSPQELRAYLNILKDAAADWKPGESHLLHVVFEERDRGAVLGVLSSEK